MIQTRSIPFVLALAILAISAAADPSFAANDAPSMTPVAPVPSREPVAAYDRWAWFKDTYWIVPQNGIYSVYHNTESNTFAVAKGQTVFHLTDYFNGYFTGIVVVKLSQALLTSCQFVLGQVTPEGRVYMTMYDATTGEEINTPLGTMVRKGGQWTMVNQMTAPAPGGTLSHWAYMVQSRPGDRTFQNLPFVHESIPEFLSACPPGPTIQR